MGNTFDVTYISLHNEHKMNCEKISERRKLKIKPINYFRETSMVSE